MTTIISVMTGQAYTVEDDFAVKCVTTMFGYKFADDVMNDLLKENSGLLSRMKMRDAFDKLNTICEKSFEKDLTNP